VSTRQVRADFSDDAVTDEHLPADEVTRVRVDCDIVAANEDLFGRDRYNLR
jgi:hypothetical protein